MADDDELDYIQTSTVSELMRQARADEDVRIARAIKARADALWKEIALTHYGANDFARGNDLAYCAGLRAAQEIAENGGRDG